MNSNSILYYGSRTPRIKLLPLKAGPLTMRFDPNIGHLLQIRLGDHEIVRRIFAAIRDEAWSTVPSALSNLKTEITANSFHLRFDVDGRLGPVDYFWRGAISGDAQGTVRFEFDGIARSHFRRNRLGICVLHPIVECAGKAFEVEHTDGRRESGRFPKGIAPQQPCFDIAAFAHEVVPGVRAEFRFTGEVFEQEDQRNFSDASYKIYSTPQARPKPVDVHPGEMVQQTVTLTLTGVTRPVLPVVQGRPPQLSIATTSPLPLPPLGLAVESHGRPLTPVEIGRLRALRLAHLRVDLKLPVADWRQKLERAASEAAAVGAGLHVALQFSGAAEAEADLRALAEAVAKLPARVALWIIAHPSESPASEAHVAAARTVLQAATPNVLFAASTRNFFWELNNNRPPPGAPTLPCLPTHPQIHLTDDSTLLENVPGAAYAIEAAKEFSPKPVAISTLTLRGGFNPGPYPAYATANDLPPEVDPRQMSLLGAAWTLGSLAQMLHTGHAHSITCFETVGWRGLMEAAEGSPLPEKFPSTPGAVFPLYHLLADLGEFAGQQVYVTHSSLPQQLAGLTLFGAKGRRLIVANLLDEVQEAKIKTGTAEARVRYLDETTAGEALAQPEIWRARAGESVRATGGKLELTLRPYALATVDLV